jgi:Fe-coproporphyrin III synthase
MTEEIAQSLKENGLSRIQVSLDGAKASTHEKLRQFDGGFEKALHAIRLVKKAGISHIGVAFTPTKFNCHELEDAFKICHDIGINEFRLQPLMLLGRAKINSDKLLPSKLQYRSLVRSIYSLQERYGIGSIIWGDPIDHLVRFPTDRGSLVAFITIRANGEIVASPYLPLIVGNLRRYSFAKYWREGLVKLWQSKAVRQFATRVKSSADLMKEHKNLPVVYFDQDIYMDMIDKNLLKGVVN